MTNITSIDILKSALKPHGFTFRDLEVGPSAKKITILTDRQNHSMLFASDGPLYPFATASARILSKNKAAAYDYVSLQGVQVPKSLVLSENPQKAKVHAFLEEYKRLVAKPLDSALSNGVTVDIQTKQQLDAAIVRAEKFSKTVILQEQFIGEEFRFVVVSNKVAAVMMRQKAHVVGDGKSTIAKLIKDENINRSKIKNTAISYPILTEKLVSKKLLNSTDVLPRGAVKELNKNTMIRGGASVYNVAELIHKSYVNIAEKATQEFGKGFMVVDLMIKDYTRPSSDDNYVFLEFNICPALTLFYSCRDGGHFTVAEDYLAPMIAKVIKGTKI